MVTLIKRVKTIDISGELIIRKTDLGIKNYKITYNGKIGLLKIPVYSKMNVTFNPVWQIFPFPFLPDKQGCLPHSNLTHNCSLIFGKNANERIINYNYPHGPFEYICEGPMEYKCKKKSKDAQTKTYTTYYLKTPSSDYYKFEYNYSPDIKNIVYFSLKYNKYPNTRQKYFSFDLELISSNIKN